MQTENAEIILAGIAILVALIGTIGLRLAPRTGHRGSKGLRGTSRPTEDTPVGARGRSGLGKTQSLEPFRGRVWVVDGDTLMVSGRTIRLHGVDAPELDQKGGQKAKSHLIQITGGKIATVIPVCVDCYGRTVATLWVGETDISRHMTREGYAVSTKRYCRDYVEEEGIARRERRGLWKDDPVNGIRDPATFRRWRNRTQG